jgi:hypothetical protein
MFTLVTTGETVARRVTVRRALAALTCAVAFTLAPRPAAAVTVDQIVALSKAGVSEAVILALLDRDRTVLTIDPEQLVTLKREGLSDTLIMAMLKNGRDEAEEAARVVAEENAASILATLPLSSSLPAPDFVVVGHGPERPNASYSSTGFRTGRAKGVYAPSLPALPYGPALPPAARGYSRHQGDPYGERMLCLAQVNTARGAGLSYITECPAVMQPTRR